MSKNTGYRILEPADVVEHLRRRGQWDDRSAEVREVSDGNVNRVFVVTATDGSRSLAVKQALPWVRVAGPSWPLGPERAHAEARAYQQLAVCAPESIPLVLDYDSAEFALVLEDLSDLTVLRT